MKLRSLLFFATFIVCNWSAQAQKATVTSEKLLFKLNEEIKVVFEIDTKVDSVSDYELHAFEIVGSLKTVESTSTVNKDQRFSRTTTATLKARKPGMYSIKSPNYFIGSKIFTGEPLSITIDNSMLSPAELHLIALKKIAKQSPKEGSVRFVATDNMGFAEEMINGKWEFLRELSKNEVEQIKKK